MNQLREQYSRQTINEGLALANKFSKYIKPMTEAVTRKTGKPLGNHMVSTVAHALEETRKWLGSMDETTKALNAGNFVDYGYKLITAVLPNLVVDQICSVQPLKLRSGEVFYMNFRYGSSKGNITAGDTAIGAQTGYQPSQFNYSTETVEEEAIETGNGSLTNFTGNLAYIPVKPGTVSITTGSVTATDNGAGALSGSGISSGTIDYTTGAYSITYATAPANSVVITATYDFNMEQNPAGIGQIDIDLAQTTITARPYKLRALYTLDAAYDLQQAHGINADDELVAGLASIIRAEIDESVMKNMLSQAGAGTVSFDAQVPIGVSKQDHYDSFIHTITRGGNLIYSQTRMVNANFIIAGNNVASIIEGMSQFQSNGVEANGQFSGPYVAGTIANRYLVVKCPSYNPNDFLLGFKGNNYLYAGYIWAPYRPLYTTQPIVLDDMVARRGLFTSGGQKMINNKFYVKGTITNY